MAAVNTSPTTGPTTEPTINKRAEWIRDLRDLADFLEANPEIPAPVSGQTIVTGVYAYDDTPALDKMARIARLPGRWEKSHDESTFDLTRMFGKHRLLVFASREQVCERVVTGTETVTREVPDPDLAAKVPTVTVTETVETVEWVCPESLLAVGDER